MSSADDAPNNLNRATHVDVVRPLISSAEPDPENQSAVTLGSAVGEHEKLLDIDSLLKIAQLIGKVGKDSRLDSKDEAHTKPAGVRRGPRRKG